MNCVEVIKLYNEFVAAGENHDCPEDAGEDFVRCEVCERSRQAHARLQHGLMDIVGLLIGEMETKNDLMQHIIQDLDFDQRPRGLQMALLHALANREGKECAPANRPIS